MTHHGALGRRPHHSSHWKRRRVFFLLVRRMSLVVIQFSANRPFFFSPSSLSSPQKITQYVGGVHAIQCPLSFGAARDSLQWSDCRRWLFDFPPLVSLSGQVMYIIVLFVSYFSISILILLISYFVSFPFIQVLFFSIQSFNCNFSYVWFFILFFISNFIISIFVEVIFLSISSFNQIFRCFIFFQFDYYYFDFFLILLKLFFNSIKPSN